MNRRALLARLGTVTAVGLSGRLSSEQLAHTVSVYNHDTVDGQYQPHEVEVTVQNAQGDRLYHETYRFGEDKAADESGAFSADSEPDRLIVAVDGESVDELWPTPECGEETRSGVEVHVYLRDDQLVTLTGICETEPLTE